MISFSYRKAEQNGEEVGSEKVDKMDSQLLDWDNHMSEWWWMGVVFTNEMR